jgi:dTDP-4-dehydrorhamnose 3,5-epimerase
MEIKEKEISGVYEIILAPKEDDRGFFMRTYDKKKFIEFGIDREWVQENHSFSKDKHTIRGLHFQYSPDCEAKMLRAVSGRVFQVAVDLRKNSPTFGKWASVTLDADKKNIMFIPRGCAAGMCTLTDNCNVLYKVDNYYARDNQDSIKWNDPNLKIAWPIKKPQVISEKDENAISFKQFIEKTNNGIIP